MHRAKSKSAGVFSSAPVNAARRGHGAGRERRGASLESIDSPRVDRSLRPNESTFRNVSRDGYGATLDAIGCVGARRSISRQIPCSGRKGGINSLLARINSLPSLNSFPATADEVPCSGGIHGLSARRRTRFLNHFPPVRLPDASRRAAIGYAVAV